MPILAIVAIVFLGMAVGGLLIMVFLSIILPEFVTTDRAELALKIIAKTLSLISFIGLAGLIVTGIVAMCLYFPC